MGISRRQDGIWETHLSNTARYLEQQTGRPWKVDGETLHVSVKISGQTDESDMGVLKEKINALGVKVFSAKSGRQHTVSSYLTMDISDPTEIERLAVKAGSLREVPRPPVSQIQPKPLADVARFLSAATKVSWTVDGKTLRCTGPSIQEEAGNWPKIAQKLLDWSRTSLEQWRKPICLSEEEVSFSANEHEGRLTATISDQSVLRRLACLSDPPRVITDANGAIRALTTVAYRMCAMAGTYDANQLGQPNAEKSLPFPVLSLSGDGLHIALPSELAENLSVHRAFKKNFRYEMRPIIPPQEKYGRQFVEEMVVPLRDVRGFLERRLGFSKPLRESYTLLDDIIEVNKHLSPEQVQVLLQGRGL